MSDDNIHITPGEDDLISKFNDCDIDVPGIDNKRIIVVGVGGGGNNAVDHMLEQDVKGVSFVNVNTDAQQLKKSLVPTRVLIGPTVTRGRGAGNDPSKANAAAEESAVEISKIFTDSTDMVFITAGMGGGTGTGAAPVVSRIAHERGILTIGIITIPFLFEGMLKINQALRGAEEMSKYVDALMIINNERLIEIYKDLEFDNAFAKADDILTVAASSISELITKEGKINLDFNDVSTTLRNGGTAIISVGYGEGEGRVTKAINDALESPLLKNTDVYSSKRLLFNLYYSREASQKFVTSEMTELNDFVTRVQQDVDVIWGVTYDESLGDKVKFTILAAGFGVTIGDNHEYRPSATTTGDTATVGGVTADEREQIGAIYGNDKIDEITRQKETKQYILLSPDDLDSDEAISRIEASPTYARGRMAQATVPPVKTQTTDAATPTPQKRDQNEDPRGRIHFSSDDD